MRPQEKQRLKQFNAFEKLEILAMIESGKFITLEEMEYISYSSAFDFSKVIYVKYLYIISIKTVLRIFQQGTQVREVDDLAARILVDGAFGNMIFLNI